MCVCLYICIVYKVFFISSNAKETLAPSVPIRPRTSTIRPPSARPGAPRVRDRGEVLIHDDVK